MLTLLLAFLGLEWYGEGAIEPVVFRRKTMETAAPWLPAYYDGSLEDLLRGRVFQPRDIDEERAELPKVPGGSEETVSLDRKAS